MTKDREKTGLGNRIAAARKHAGLSQTALGKEFSLTRSAVSQWESETTEPTSANLRAIAIRCGVDYDWLATRRGTMIKNEDSAELTEAIELLRTDAAFREMVSAYLRLRKDALTQKHDPASQDQPPSTRK